MVFVLQTTIQINFYVTICAVLVVEHIDVIETQKVLHSLCSCLVIQLMWNWSQLTALQVLGFVSLLV